MRFLLIPVLALCLSSCSEEGFGEPQVRQILTSGTKQLDGEQVILTGDQLNCGERQDLWTIEAQGYTNSIARLTPKAKELGFGDDVRIEEQRAPYTQLRGQFQLQVMRINKIEDEGANRKVVDASVGVIVSHSCFANPLPLMGVRKGEFNPDVPARFQLALNGSWEYDRLLH